MRLPTRATASLATALALAGSFGLAGCSSGGQHSSHGAGSSGGHTTEASQAKIQTTVAKVSGLLATKKRARMRDQVSAIVDSFLDHAYLGSFPRTDYSAAFRSFTRGARKDAMAQLDLMSSQSLSSRIDSATATRKRVKLDAFAPHGQSRGVTASFVLEFTTSGQDKTSQRVAGDLYLSHARGAWQVFGYAVDEPVAQAASQ